MCNQVCPPNSTQHVITAGDTFWRLSQSYGVSLQSIFDANPGVDPQNLQIGSTVCIPAVPTSYAPQMQPTACPEGTFSYTIQAGDTFWRLSQTYGVDLQSIIDANPSVDPQNLQIDSTICIPVVSTPTTPQIPQVTCPEGTFSYMIQAGDTFWRLSQAFDVDLQSIIDANPGADPMNLQIGSTICIPTAAPQAPQIPPAACPDGTFSYTIQAGDTFWRLSQTFGVDLQRIIDANPGADPMNLQIGSTVCIPIMPTPIAPQVPQMPSMPQMPKMPQVPQMPITPPAVPTPPAPPSYFAYLIRKCDTICRIARKFYVSEDSLLQINPEIDPRCLVTGTIIYVPINCCGPNMFRYVVRSGDTLNRIANRFNVCPLDLIAANPNIDFDCLVRCQIICIPSA